MFQNFIDASPRFYRTCDGKMAVLLQKEPASKASKRQIHLLFWQKAGKSISIFPVIRLQELLHPPNGNKGGLNDPSLLRRFRKTAGNQRPKIRQPSLCVLYIFISQCPSLSILKFPAHLICRLLFGICPEKFPRLRRPADHRNSECGCLKCSVHIGSPFSFFPVY